MIQIFLHAALLQLEEWQHHPCKNSVKSLMTDELFAQHSCCQISRLKLLAWVMNIHFAKYQGQFQLHH
jgi:hypothetical protein